MFQFPRFPPLGLCVQPRVTGHLPLPGFPIRISTDRSLVGGSPWLIAATHVLHRHLAPRHPPLALCSLEFQDARARYAVLKELVRCSRRRLARRRQTWGAGSRRGDVHAAPEDPKEETGQGPRRGPVPFLQNGIVMTALPWLRYQTLETTHRGAFASDKPNNQ
jgi:hypothetical protein